MRVASDRSASMATWIGGAIAAGLHTRGYAVMLPWLTRTISGNGSRPNDNIEKVTGSPLITSRTSPDGMHTHGSFGRPSDHAHRRIRRLRGAGRVPLSAELRRSHYERV